MPLPVLSLSSLASRVVLSQHLDTRELPLHLHREMEDYKRLHGTFIITEVVFEVQRIDWGELSEDEREEAWQFYLKSDVGKRMMETEAVSWKSWTPTRSKWCVAKTAGGQRTTILQLKNPIAVVHDNKVGKYWLKDQRYVNVHRASYLENGKIVAVSKVEEHQPEVGMTEVSEDTSSIEISETDCLTMVQQFQKPLLGLTFSFTTRASRVQVS